MSRYHAKPYLYNLVNAGMTYLYAVVTTMVAYKLSDVANF